jgi:hypothetical protein
MPIAESTKPMDNENILTDAMGLTMYTQGRMSSLDRDFRDSVNRPRRKRSFVNGIKSRSAIVVHCTQRNYPTCSMLSFAARLSTVIF